jgi:hypothetical protein
MMESGVRFFIRAVVNGFAFSLGVALFKKIQGRLGLAEEKDKKEEAADEPETSGESDGEPKLQS